MDAARCNTARDRLEIIYGSVDRALDHSPFLHRTPNRFGIRLPITITPEGHFSLALRNGPDRKRLT